MDLQGAVEVFLDASPDELRAVLDEAPIGIAVLRGPELVYEYVNHTFQAFAPGVTLVGRPFADASWELPDIGANLRDVWATGRPWHAVDLPTAVERRVGQPLERATFSVHCVKVQRRTPPDAILGFVAETSDRVQALEQARAALDDARQRSAELEAIIETMVEGVIVFDAQRNVTLLNSAARRLVQMFTGRDAADVDAAAEILQHLDASDLDGRPVDSAMIPVARALAGVACRSTFRFTNPVARREVYASIGAAPIRSARGEIVGAVTVGSDVTEMAELDRLKEEFIRQIAHELKTPITIMKGYASILMSTLATSLSPVHGRMLDAINRSADRIDRIMRELLDAQQIELGRFQVTIERVDLTDLVEEVVNRVGGASAHHPIRLVASEPLTIFGDPERLREVMRILLDNAIRYSPGGGAIEVSLRRVDTGVEVAVRDHGIGIPRSRQARIFQRFYRAHAGTAHDYGGTGLGLYVARAIVARHGGRIWFETAEGRGTTFTFWIPWRAADGAQG